MKDFLIAIISSEKTWKNFARFGMDLKIEEKRNEFDLHIVLNGFNQEAIEFYARLKPQQIYVRPNLGFDPAAVAHLLGKIPVYKHTLIMHDDHWFLDDDWFEKLKKYADDYPEIDIFGNILFMESHFLFDEYCKTHGLEFLSDNSKNGFLHGISGLYSANAIEKLKKFKNLPQDDTTEKTVADVEERIYSAIFRHLKLKVSGFSEPLYKFFKHNSGNYRNSLILEGNYYYYNFDFEKTIKIYSKYIEYCKKINYDKDLGLAYFNLATSYFMLGRFDEAKINYVTAKRLAPEFVLNEKVYEKFPDLHNIV